MNYFRIGSGLAGIAVILGAFGAHALEELLTEDSLSSYLTGVRYQLVHGIVICLLAAIFRNEKTKLKRILLLMTLGVMLFSFSIYALVFLKHLDISWNWVFGPITPIGGSLLIISWFYLLISAGSIWGNIVEKSDV